MRERELCDILDSLQASHGDPLNNIDERVGKLISQVGVWELAHRLRLLSAEQRVIFLEYLERAHPAAADRIQILLMATKGEDKELLKREFGGD